MSVCSHHIIKSRHIFIIPVSTSHIHLMSTVSTSSASDLYGDAGSRPGCNQECEMRYSHVKVSHLYRLPMMLLTYCDLGVTSSTMNKYECFENNRNTNLKCY